MPTLTSGKPIGAPARNNTFYLLGSKDETGRNQSCVATLAEDGSFTLRVRVPNALVEHNGGLVHLSISGVCFAYGHEELVTALKRGQAVSYRFLRDEKGWRVFASFDRLDQRKVFKEAAVTGVVGVDINHDHLAVTETDRFGNPTHSFSVPCVTYGKTSGQRLALIRDAAIPVVEHAVKAGKPIVVEKLDFGQRRKEL